MTVEICIFYDICTINLPLINLKQKKDTSGGNSGGWWRRGIKRQSMKNKLRDPPIERTSSVCLFRTGARESWHAQHKYHKI